MDSLEENSHQLRTMSEREEQRVRFYETRSLHQTIFFLLFQAIILFSVSSVRCQNWWLPFSLSLIVALLFFAVHVSTVAMYLRAQLRYDSNTIQLELMRSPSNGTGSDNSNVPIRDGFRMYKQRFQAYSVVLLLVGFTGVVLFACHSVPCSLQIYMATGWVLGDCSVLDPTRSHTSSIIGVFYLTGTFIS